MKFFLAFIALMAVASANHREKLFTTIEELYAGSNRIINGSPAKEGQFPWQVSVRFNTFSGTSFCGGSIISDRWILTAAHCTTGANSFTIQVGTTKSTPDSGTTVTATRYVHHPDYNAHTNNDIAVIQLDQPLQFNSNVQPIKLPQRGDVIGVNQALTVSGWGKTSDASSTFSTDLNYVGLKTISNTECAAVYGTSTIISSTLCCGTGNPLYSTCDGDSGGPLVRIESDGSATHVGVVSFVHIKGCERGQPSGYMRTESFLDWIAENTRLSV